MDRIEGGTIEGWAFDEDQPTSSIELSIYVGGKLFTTVVADQHRPDLQTLGTGRVEYGFAVEAPSGMRPDEVVFGRYKDEFIIQSPSSRQSHLRGWIDRIEGGTIEGWAFDEDQPASSIELSIYVGGKLFTTVFADQPRADLQILGTGRVEYGFAVEAPSDMRFDEMVFGRYKDEFIIQSPSSRRSHIRGWIDQLINSRTAR
jgi:hypothetical protein